ncbi:MAG: hypothetical protein RI906_1270 [Pseudomonadota bacterium]|jgi:hypothetical protein
MNTTPPKAPHAGCDDDRLDQTTFYLDAYIRWHNEARIKISLRSMSPLEHRTSLENVSEVRGRAIHAMSRQPLHCVWSGQRLTEPQ